MAPSQRPASATFLGSERGSVEVHIYSRRASRVSLYSGNIHLAEDNDDPTLPKLTGCNVSNALGGGGTFSLNFWLPEACNLCRLVEVDAWVDISFCRGDTCWHVMRGTVEEVRPTISAGGNGVTVREGSITGRSFQKCWETTRLFFNEAAADNKVAAVFRATVSGRLNQTPPQNLRAVLFGLFREIANLGRANWALPALIPGRKGSLDEVVYFDESMFDHVNLPRFTPTGQITYPDGMVWDVATQYMDGSHCELFTDILPSGGLRALKADPSMAGGLDPADSRMTVIFRDKPFPLVDYRTRGRIGDDSNWFRLPTWTVGWQEVRQLGLGTSSTEVLNSFMNLGLPTGEGMSHQATNRSPLWSPSDMRRRGMRSMDAVNPYSAIAAKISPGALVEARRARLRDWYCMGGELKNGSVALWRGYPEIKVGGRLHIVGDSPEDQATAYIEGVRHAWQVGAGCSTSLSVTRCYEGSKDEFISRLTTVSQSYQVAPNNYVKPK